MNKRIQLILILSLLTTALLAQPYDNAVGIRAGYSSGLNFKHITRYDIVIEGNALYSRHGFHLTGLLAYQFTPYDRKRIHYYAGGGMFAGRWEEEGSFGVALVVGTEYVFRFLPLVIGLEWKPMFNITKTYGQAIPDIGLTFRFKIK